MRDLIDMEAPDLWNSFKVGYLKLVTNYVEREDFEETEEIHGGGMWKVKNQKKEKNKRHSARTDPKKT